MVAVTRRLRYLQTHSNALLTEGRGFTGIDDRVDIALCRGAPAGKYILPQPKFSPSPGIIHTDPLWASVQRTQKCSTNRALTHLQR
jgi:hypothetical protein